jgi:uncharacterized protein (TIGR01777 family)
LRFLLAGASGFLGRAWAGSLVKRGHTVVRLVRRQVRGEDESRWDPYAGMLDPEVVESADVVANLAGAPLAHWPWTARYKSTFTASRVTTTRVLAQAVARSARQPVLMAQSGIAGYGDRGAEVITEDTPLDGSGFLAEVTRLWEAATEPAAGAGARVVVMRTAVVLDRTGGALKPMLPIFRLGLGGRFGSGEQYFPTISLSDWVSAATYLAQDATTSGAYNVSGPDTSTNAEFVAELARQVHRPALLRVPALPLRAAGGVAGASLLDSVRVEPRRLIQSGYAFAHNDLQDRVAAALHASSST